MASVYSYIRFSSKRQEQGDSVRRQLTMGEAWMKRHPEHTLNTTIRLRDLGVSAFKGKNLDKTTGDLGKFIALAQQENSPIPHGSILMLENLDRFSRQPARKAYRAFCELVEAGVAVQTLDPEQFIDESNIDGIESVLTVILKMQLSFEESRKKSQRLSAAWKNKRQQAQEKGTPLTRLCPSWLGWDERAEKFVVKSGAEKTLCRIFNLSCDGIGQRSIAAELNGGKVKPFTGTKWNGSFVQHVLQDRAVLGEFQPHKFDLKGERIPDGSPLVGYFPQVVSDDLFYRAASARTNRRAAKGRHAEFVNLLVGLVKGSDSHPLHIQTARHKRADGTATTTRRLVSYGHLQGVKGACGLTMDYGRVERYVMACLWELKQGDILPAKGKQNDNGIGLKRRELAGMEARLVELEAALGDNKQPVPQLLTAITELTAKRDGLRGMIERMNRTGATAKSKPIEAIHDLLSVIEAKPEDERHDLRLKLRGLIADVVEVVEVEPRKDGRRVEVRLTIYWKSDRLAERNIVIDTGTLAVEDVRGAMASMMPAMELAAQATQHKPRPRQQRDRWILSTDINDI